MDRTNRPSNDLEAEAEEDLESAPVTLDEKLQWRRFQEVARKVMARHFNEDLHERAIPDVSKRFDMVSSDGSVVGDAKYLSLVRGKTRPPAKFMEIAGHIWLLEKTNAKRIFLVFGNQRDVASLWLKKYGTVAGRVEMYFVDSDGKLDRMRQGSAKQTVVEIVEAIDSSYEEILQELIMNRMIERGLADVEAGRTISDEKMAKTIESWRD